MAYFNNAFRKTIIMSDYVAPVAAAPGTTAASGALASGDVSLYDFKAHTPLNVGASGAGDAATACPFIVAAGAPYVNDKVGPFHGGYKESIKSKGINPKYISKIWSTDANAAQAAILHVGKTPYTQVSSSSTANCCPKFLCGENYHLRVDVKGSPALRTLNHQAYEEITAYTGCCPDGTIVPTQVNPVKVYVEWSKAISDSVILTGRGPNGASNAAPFLIPVVYVTEAGDAGAYAAGMTIIWPTGTAAGVQTAGRAAVATKLSISAGTIVNTTVAAYELAGIPAYTDQCAGMSLVGAYQETIFGDCTFQPSDFYGVEPVRLFASEVDLNGDPCEFAGVCTVDECKGRQAQGLGETLARDFILSESYRQIPFATDLRIREITQGNDMLGTGVGQVDRTALYDRLMILHTVPRFNNPSGTFDNDQYLIEIATPSTTAGKADRTALVSDLTNILTAADNENACVIQTAQGNSACAAASIVVVA